VVAVSPPDPSSGLELDHDRYRPNADADAGGPQHELDRVEPSVSAQGASMSETAGHDHSAAAAHPAAHPPADPAWPTPHPTLPPEQLTDRELIARAAYCDDIAHTGRPADQAAALRNLDAAWDEAERRAAGQPPSSVPAQVAGYIGLVREDYDHALAAEAATWRQQLDAALPPSELLLDDPQDRRVPTALDEPGARNHDGQLEARNDPQRLRQRVEDLRAAIGAREAGAQGEVDGEQRREQLDRWHDDDHRAPDATTEGGLSEQYTQVGDGDGEPGWSR
jgi:hypothetical protein